MVDERGQHPGGGRQLKSESQKEAARIIRDAFREAVALELGPLHPHRGTNTGRLPEWFAIPASPEHVTVVAPAVAFLQFKCSYEPDVWGAALAGVIGRDIPIKVEIRANDQTEADLFEQSKVARRLRARRQALADAGVPIDAWISINGVRTIDLTAPDLDTPPPAAAVYDLDDLAIHGSKLTREAQREKALRDNPSLLGYPYNGEITIVANQFPIGFKGEAPDRLDLLATWRDRLLVIELKESSKELDILAQGLDYVLFFRRARSLQKPPLNRPTRLILAADVWHPRLRHAIAGMKLASVVDLDVREWSPVVGQYIPFDVRLGDHEKGS